MGAAGTTAKRRAALAAPMLPLLALPAALALVAVPAAAAPASGWYTGASAGGPALAAASEPPAITLYEADWYTGSREAEPWVEGRAPRPAFTPRPVAPRLAATPSRPRVMRTAAPASSLRAAPATRVAIDASVSVTSRGSVFGALSGTMALNRTLRESGGRVRIEGLAGTYDYDAGTRRISTQQTEAAASVGYEWVMPRASVAAFVGVGVKSAELSAPDPSNKVQGTSFGLKVAMSAYANPTDSTMLSGYASYSTNNGAYYTRVKAGYAAFDARGPLGTAFVGPEVSFLGDSFYKQTRIGAHITGLSIGQLQVGAAGGFVQDPKQGSGAYAILDARLSF